MFFKWSILTDHNAINAIIMEFETKAHKWFLFNELLHTALSQPDYGGHTEGKHYVFPKACQN